MTKVTFESFKEFGKFVAAKAKSESQEFKISVTAFDGNCVVDHIHSSVWLFVTPSGKPSSYGKAYFAAGRRVEVQY